MSIAASTRKALAGMVKIERAITEAVRERKVPLNAAVFPWNRGQGMVTVYTRDGENVSATHYCTLGNQPHLVSKAGGPPNQMHFDFVSGANMKSAKDAHMHSLTVNFLDDNHVKQEWQPYLDGKPVEKTGAAPISTGHSCIARD